MKERTFYTINLDMKRILIILFILLLFFAYFFFLGRVSNKEKAKNQIVEEIKKENPVDQKNESTDKLSDLENIKTEKNSETIELKSNVKEEAKTTTPVVELAEEKKQEITPAKVTKTYSKRIKKKNSKKENLNEEKETTVFYSIQLGAFSSEEQATKFKNKVIQSNKKLGKNYVPIVQKDENFFVVRLGRSNSKEELEKVIQNLDPKTQSYSMILSNQKR